MWLINATTFKRENLQPESSRYATLSHTWEDGEITFQDWSLRMAPGMIKVLETCQLARSKMIPYVWVDTCCIDKTSSAELSEAINSMFRWYDMGEVCFVYLSDLVATKQKRVKVLDKISTCRWFTRGWTLQELIAPKLVEFYDANWQLVGTKADSKFQARLAQITGIDREVLQDNKNLGAVTVGIRLCWASKRNTTRVEDMAYCLFGIFDIHMPLIYGEGQKAFYRLQEAIAAGHDDLSLFCWSSMPKGNLYQEWPQRGMTAAFAPSLRLTKQTDMCNVSILTSSKHRQGNYSGSNAPACNYRFCETYKTDRAKDNIKIEYKVRPQHLRDGSLITLHRISANAFTGPFSALVEILFVGVGQGPRPTTTSFGIVLGVKPSYGYDYDSGFLWRHTAESGLAGSEVRELFANWDSWPVEYSAARLQDLYSSDARQTEDFIRLDTPYNFLQYTVRFRFWDGEFKIETEISDHDMDKSCT
ncbi:hypothetical protein PspLS_11399 [Pyricularia sp. CBS 133598]|nr:hypothetical protein PspLS_11399 [Pyricularia sp. CBS 133598]